MSPLPMFLFATAALAAFAFFLLLRMFRTRVPVRRPLALRRQRAGGQVRWDRLHPPAADL